MPFRRKRSQLMGKVAIQHADTLVANIGPSSVPTEFEVMETEAGLRSTTGATQTIKDSASTGEVCNVGDTIKYINLFIQAAARPSISVPNDRPGWIEWAVVMVKESETSIPNTQLGVQTLGNVATNMFRNECIYTGAFSIGLNNPNMATIKIKVPKFKQKIRFGDEWRLYVANRSNNTTDTSTDSVRVILSFMYKAYS